MNGASQSFYRFDLKVLGMIKVVWSVLFTCDTTLTIHGTSFMWSLYTTSYYPSPSLRVHFPSLVVVSPTIHTGSVHGFPTERL